MLKEHIEAFLRIAERSDTIIGFRPVNWAARSLIQAGYPTKNFHIKTKSAKWGPQIGLLCPRPEEVIDPAYAVRKPLLLSAQRLAELEHNGLISIEGKHGVPINQNSFVFLANALETGEATPSASGQSHRYIAMKQTASASAYTPDKTSDLCWAIEEQAAQNGSKSAIEVLCCPDAGKPFTADYDLLSYGRPVHCFNRPDNKSIMPTHTILDVVMTRRTQAGHSDESAPNTHCNSEDPDRGNLSEFCNVLIDTLNGGINRGEHLNLVHHNIDAHNPYSTEAGNYPAIFCVPRVSTSAHNEFEQQPSAENFRVNLKKLTEMNVLARTPIGEQDTNPWAGSGVIVIKDERALNRFREDATQRGYKLENSALWLGGAISSEENNNPPLLRSWTAYPPRNKDACAETL
jgi:adenylate cyclase ExoY